MFLIIRPSRPLWGHRDALGGVPGDLPDEGGVLEDDTQGRLDVAQRAGGVALPRLGGIQALDVAGADVSELDAAQGGEDMGVLQMALQ